MVEGVGSLIASLAVVGATLVFALGLCSSGSSSGSSSSATTSLAATPTPRDCLRGRVLRSDGQCYEPCSSDSDCSGSNICDPAVSGCVEAPTAEAPTAEAPTAEAPSAEAPNAEAPNAEAPNAPNAEAPNAEATANPSDQ